ncbi:hypothetical protein ACQKGI_00410 [Peribacillus muralis]|uniref:hypothetical protein n=1 Tax=Peribacillus muralis TaxID=264697 RepID=UPI00382B7B30
MRMSEAFPISGSVYSYAQRGINDFFGFLAGWIILLDLPCLGSPSKQLVSWSSCHSMVSHVHRQQYTFELFWNENQFLF